MIIQPYSDKILMVVGGSTYRTSIVSGNLEIEEPNYTVRRSAFGSSRVFRGSKAARLSLSLEFSDNVPITHIFNLNSPTYIYIATGDLVVRLFNVTLSAMSFSARPREHIRMECEFYSDIENITLPDVDIEDKELVKPSLITASVGSFGDLSDITMRWARQVTRYQSNPQGDIVSRSDTPFVGSGSIQAYDMYVAPGTEQSISLDLGGYNISTTAFVNLSRSLHSDSDQYDLTITSLPVIT